MTQLIIYTDLDGTLLDHKTYSYTNAESALQLINKHNLPLIFTTSKTRKEILYWQQKLKIHHPFISENGGGIFIPHNYFPFTYQYQKTMDNLHVIELGIPYKTLLDIIKDFKQEFNLRSFAEMTPQELSKEAGLPEDQAALALQRDYELPFTIQHPTEKKAIIEKISKQNLSYMIGGRYIHLMGNHSKGDAIKHLQKLYLKQYPNSITLGLGDSLNDLSMLNEVDIPYLVQLPNQQYISPKYNHAKGIGPKGWNQAVTYEIQKHS